MNNPKLTKLRSFRSEAGYTTKKMADMLGISQSMYDYIELGRERLSYDMAVKISEIFEVSPDELFYEDFEQFFEGTLI